MLLKIEIKANEVNEGDTIIGHEYEGEVESVVVEKPHVMIVFESGTHKATSVHFKLTILTEVEC